jgi:hypothetical protein
LAKTVNHDQRPAIYNEARGNFYFFGPTTVQVAPSVPVAPEMNANQQEEKFWDDAKAVGNREAFEAYLDSYPSGRYAFLANASMAKMTIPLPSPQARPDPKRRSEALLEGIWTGFGSQDNGDSFSIQVSIRRGVSTISYPSLGCGGNLIPFEESADDTKFTEAITFQGRVKCVNGGRVVLTRLNSSIAKFEWFYSNGRKGVDATLKLMER